MSLANTGGLLLIAYEMAKLKGPCGALKLWIEIFIQLLALDEAYMLVPGLRHKSDIARRIIESTRGDITLEVRRKSLEDYLKKFTPPEAEAKGGRKRAKAKE